jgi:hypothetical protein
MHDSEQSDQTGCALRFQRPVLSIRTHSYIIHAYATVTCIRCLTVAILVIKHQEEKISLAATESKNHRGLKMSLYRYDLSDTHSTSIRFSIRLGRRLMTGVLMLHVQCMSRSIIVSTAGAESVLENFALVKYDHENIFSQWGFV